MISYIIEKSFHYGPKLIEVWFVEDLIFHNAHYYLLPFMEIYSLKDSIPSCRTVHVCREVSGS